MADLSKTRAVINAFGRRVREQRRAAGLSQPALGRLSRVGPKFIGLIERGESNPSLATMVLVADALGCDVVSLLPSAGAAPIDAAYVRVREDDLRRAKEAIARLGSLPKRRRQRRST